MSALAVAVVDTEPEIAAPLWSAILQALAQLKLAAPLAMVWQPLGLSNRSARLCYGEHSLLLRLNSPVTDRICDRANEVACWRAAESAGLAPPLLWVDAQYRFYLSRWISESASDLGQGYLPWQGLSASVVYGAAQATEDDAGWHGALGARLKPTSAATQDIGQGKTQAEISSAHGFYPAQRLLTLLLGLRQLPAPALEISLQQQWHIYLQRLQLMANTGDYAGAGTAVGQQWLRRWHWLQQVAVAPLFAGLDNCLLQHQYCHRDLSAYNLLLHEDRLLCIDFEYCCSAHPLFELAGVLACHRLAAAPRQWLIEQYLQGHPYLRADAIRQLPAALDIFWLYSCAWALQMAQTNAADSEQYWQWFDNYRQLVRK